MNIEIISGSPRQVSVTHRVALHLQQQISTQAPEDNIGLISMQEIPLPAIQSVWTGIGKVPDAFRSLAERMFAADAFIVVTPEYNGGYSPAMKNLFDHFPKQVKKTFGICTASPGAMGGMRASQQLLQLVPALFGIASPTMLVTPAVDKKFDEAGNLTDETFGKNVHDFITDFLWLARVVQAAR